MTLKDQVTAFVSRRAPKAVCDNCIADHLATSRRQVSAVAPSLKIEGLFLRVRGRCSGCCTLRTVTAIVG
jgi:hypothetical protein